MFTKKYVGPVDCASCEKGITNLSGLRGEQIHWNKLPFREPTDRIAKVNLASYKLYCSMVKVSVDSYKRHQRCHNRLQTKPKCRLKMCVCVTSRSPSWSQFPNSSTMRLSRQTNGLSVNCRRTPLPQLWKRSWPVQSTSISLWSLSISTLVYHRLGISMNIELI